MNNTSRTFNWICNCGSKIKADTKRATATRTCRSCRRVWVLDVAAGSVTSNSTSAKRAPYWSGISSSGTAAYAGESEALGLCNSTKYTAVCAHHGYTVGTDSWSMAKHSAQHTAEFCGACCGDLVDGPHGPLFSE